MCKWESCQCVLAIATSQLFWCCNYGVKPHYIVRQGLFSFVIILVMLHTNVYPSLSVSLTQTKKKGLEMKQNLVEEIRNSLDNYDHVYIFSAHHIRTNKLKDMRLEWGQSRFAFFCYFSFYNGIGNEAKESVSAFFLFDEPQLRSLGFESTKKIINFFLKVKYNAYT